MLESRNIRLRLAGSVALVALSAGVAYAQDTNVEQVVVSGSRIQMSGYSQPTPVTVLDSAMLERDATVDVGDAIRQLPALGASSGPNNTTNSGNIAAGNAGADLVNLRNLGFLRTLVLVDGQRVTSSNLTGGVDLGTVPTSVLQRVDVVTGGASAAWGSDAIAGVVNLVLDKKLTGFKANLEGGTSYKADHNSYKLEATYGTAFDGDRGHVIVSGSYVASPDLVLPGSRRWAAQQPGLGLNPAFTATNGQPQYIHVNGIAYNAFTQGGVILSGPAANTQFLANGVAAPFNKGVTSDALCYSCDGSQIGGRIRALAIPYRTSTLFGYGSYQITDWLKASLQLNYGGTADTTTSTQYNITNAVQLDNAYLPATIAAQYRAAGLTSVPVGTENANNGNIKNLSLAALENSVGVPVASNRRQLYRGVFTLEGDLGSDWSWNAFWNHSISRVHEVVLHNLIKGNYTNAVDAITVSAAQAATSGLTAGSIQCRALVTGTAAQKAAAAGCQPLNIFGTGVASQAAINYVSANNGTNFTQQILNQDEISANLQGKLPWGLPAGRIAVAAGYEHRRETDRVTADAGAIAKIYNVGNFSNQFGAVNVDEGFAEIDAPILKDSLVQSLEFNVAGRITNYSSSGLVETWKLGATSQVDDNIKLRTSWSFDIRAPTLNDLYAAGAQTSTSGVVDPRTGLPVAPNPYQIAQGNPTLKPEVSTTVSGGVVLTPTFAPGLSLSADWYSIVIKNAIYTAPYNTTVQQCAANVSAFCGQLVYTGATLVGINVSPVNAASATTSGLDVQADYTMPLWDGNLDLRTMGNYMDEQTQTALGVTTDYAGSLNNNSVVTGGVPKLKATFIASYSWGPWSGTVQERVIGSARLNNAWGPTNVDNNAVPAAAYMDLRASYEWNDNIKLYGAIDNLWNAPPPVVVDGSAINGNQIPPTRTDIYDTMGRMFRIGVRFNHD
jgi:iron complex outermembrane receptor protein